MNNDQKSQFIVPSSSRGCCVLLFLSSYYFVQIYQNVFADSVYPSARESPE
jgi:hypothetical protein